MRELTVRSIILGGAITLVFTAANVYLGLKRRPHLRHLDPRGGDLDGGAACSPARPSSRTTSSRPSRRPAGTLAAIIFVLPGLSWSAGGRAFLTGPRSRSRAIGGTLGVMFSVPLRARSWSACRLPYPEGVAAAEVLKVGAGAEGGAKRTGAKASPPSSAARSPRPAFALLARPMLVAAEAATPSTSAAARPASAGLSLALIGVGHLVGITVGMAMLLGLLIVLGGSCSRSDLSRASGGRRGDGVHCSATRSASSAPARSGSPRSGPCSRSSARSSAASARRWPRSRPARRRRGAGARRARSADRHRRRR